MPWIVAVLIGTDEAGYGPNLGPLVVSATSWKIPADRMDVDLFAEFSPVVVNQANRAGPATHVPMADSKQLYRPGAGWRDLELGLFTSLRQLGALPTGWREVWERLDPRPTLWSDAPPWYVDFQASIPRDVTVEVIEQFQTKLAVRLETAGIRLTHVRSRVVFPQELNRLIESLGNKAAALSQITLELVRDLLDETSGERTLVHCDKHGGRNKYGPLLQQTFPDYLVEVRKEGRSESVYRWGAARRRVEARFVAGGEGFLPSALASMACKYLRELAMWAFNEFWCERVKELVPTAGYPVDARRFKAAIEPTQKKLGIRDQVLWRKR